jgi:hypothetical protein
MKDFTFKINILAEDLERAMVSPVDVDDGDDGSSDSGDDDGLDGFGYDSNSDVGLIRR